MPWQIVQSQNGGDLEANILVVHAAALPTNEVLFFGGSEHSFDRFKDWKGGIDFLKTQRFRVSDNRIFNINNSPNTDLFCCGHAFLGDGRLLVGGGTRDWPLSFYGNPPPEHAHHDPLFNQDGNEQNPHEALNHWDGERACWIYQHWQRRWVRVRDMAFEPIEGMPGHQLGGGRWYPTLITLADGRVIAFAGHPSHEHIPHEHENPEIYSAGKDTWEIDANRRTDFSYRNYPRGHVMPDGRIFFASPLSGLGTGFYTPEDGSFDGVGNLPAAKRDEGITEHFFNSVLLPLLPERNYEAHVLAVGWTGDAVRIKPADGSWQSAGQRDWQGTAPARRNSCSVLLPTGQVVVVGGVRPTEVEDDGQTVLRERDSGAVHRAEVYTPPFNVATGADETEEWQTDLEEEQAQVTRNYHSVALLLSNGSVLTAGSNFNASTGHPDDFAEKRVEIYQPWYFSNADRPEIGDAPSSISYGDVLTINSPDAGSIARVAITRLGSVTHAFDADQRYVGLNIRDQSGNSIIADSPPNGNIAPPGYYMLWLIGNNGLPCQQARFVKLGHQGMFLVFNRSTISSHDVESMQLAGQTVINEVLQVVMTATQPNDYVGPELIATLDHQGGDAASTVDISFQLSGVDFDIGQDEGDTAQRIVLTYSMRITSTEVFDTFDEFRNLHIHAISETRGASGDIRLHKQPNPFMLNGEEFWLSTDLRVFKVVAGLQAPFQPFPVISGGFNPYAFLEALLDQFNTLAGGAGTHPFDTIAEEQDRAKLELSRSVRFGVGGPLHPVWNFAIARVRYRSVSTQAPDVRVMFRMFNTVGTALEFDTSTTYRRDGNDAQATQLIGRDGKVILSIPYFGTPRVNTATTSMREQPDPLNLKTLEPTGGSEGHTYFGAVLDFNQTVPRIPLYPENDGPFDQDEMLSIQELMRGYHQCLVSEIHFGDDLIPPRSTPGTSDKLSQRNIWIEETPNPGISVDSRTLMTPCELQATRTSTGSSLAAAEQNLGGFDELLLRWNNLPRDSRASIYLPSVEVDDIIDANAIEYGAPVLTKIDEHTIEFTLGDVTFLPVPRSEDRTIPGLVTIALPEGIVAGQRFRVEAHQYSDMGRPRNPPRFMVGSFEIDIPVLKSAEVISGLIRRLSV